MGMRGHDTFLDHLLHSVKHSWCYHRHTFLLLGKFLVCLPMGHDLQEREHESSTLDQYNMLNRLHQQLTGPYGGIAAHYTQLAMDYPVSAVVST